MNYLPLLMGTSEIVILFAIFFMASLGDWGGDAAEDNECLEHKPDTCFCEEVKEKSWLNVKQPSNTWSNLSFVMSGVIVMGVLAFSSSPMPQNPMQDVTGYSIFFGMLVIFLGPGSMYFHASLKKWGGWLDTFSMILFIAFLLAYTLSRLLTADEASRTLIFLSIFLLINIPAGIISWYNDNIGSRIFQILLGITALIELPVIILWLFPASLSWLIQRDARYLIATLLCFVLAYYIWTRSETDGPLCKEDNPYGWFSPKSWVQGHAIWHIWNAVATIAIFVYLRTEILH